MLKNFVFMGICFMSIILCASPEFNNAIDDLDVDEVVRILEHHTPTNNELICHIEALRAKNASYEQKEALGWLGGLIGGALLGSYLGGVFWEKIADPAEQKWLRNGELHRLVGLCIGAMLGNWGATGYNAAERAKIKTILHLLIHKIGGKIEFIR